MSALFDAGEERLGDTARLARRGSAFVLAFDRPNQMNALNAAMVEDVLEGIARAGADGACRGLVLHGSGGHFMAGADIKDYARQSGEAFRAFQVSAGRIYAALESLPKPTIAAVEGYALGGGLEIALACDMVVAHPEARMGLPEARLGLVPGGGGTQRLPRKIGPNRALELLLTGRHANAAEMERWGVVNRIADDPLAAALELVDSIARQPASAVADAKALAHAAWTVGLEAGVAREGEVLGRLFLGGDGMERIRAFVERSEQRKGSARA